MPGAITPITITTGTPFVFGFLSMDRAPYDVPTDEAWLRLATNPTAMPTFKPYGDPTIATSGATANYTNLPNLTLFIPVIGQKTLPDGSTPAGGAGTFKSWLAEWRRCRSKVGTITESDTGVMHTSQQGRMWIRCFWPETNHIVSFLCTPDEPKWSGSNAKGKLLYNLEIPLLAIGELAATYAGGNPNPPDPDDPGSEGDNYQGSYGYGGYGSGPYGGA